MNQSLERSTDIEAPSLNRQDRMQRGHDLCTYGELVFWGLLIASAPDSPCPDVDWYWFLIAAVLLAILKAILPRARWQLELVGELCLYGTFCALGMLAANALTNPFRYVFLYLLGVGALKLMKVAINRARTLAESDTEEM